MADIQGTNVAAAVAPFSTADKFPTHYAKYGHGGWREVATYSELADISSERREEGMGVFVVDEQALYVLIDGNFVKTLVKGRNGHTLFLPFLSDSSFVDGSEIDTEELEGDTMFGCTLDELSDMVKGGVALSASFKKSSSSTGISNVYGGQILKASFRRLEKLVLTFDSVDPLNSDAKTRYEVTFIWKDVGEIVDGRDESLPTKYTKASVNVVKVASGSADSSLTDRVEALEAIVSKLGTAAETQTMVETIEKLGTCLTVNPTTNTIQSINIEDQNSNQYTLSVVKSGSNSTLVLTSVDAT